MSPLFIATLIIWAISAVGLIVLVLLHSGRGAGLSETFGGSMGGDFGTGVIEKNLNRITIVCSLVFIGTLIAMIFVWPTGNI
ncbi:MAG: preprotein translocase subunit SecG [Coriobacteriia bacterium]|nr:preprotein translocase subunit SecG [Coriobacteriia bacterium]